MVHNRSVVSTFLLCFVAGPFRVAGLGFVPPENKVFASSFLAFSSGVMNCFFGFSFTSSMGLDSYSILVLI